LAGIHLCNVCSCQEILRRNGQCGQVRLGEAAVVEAEALREAAEGAAVRRIHGLGGISLLETVTVPVVAKVPGRPTTTLAYRLRAVMTTIGTSGLTD
jgi:hypothetical protein